MAEAPRITVADLKKRMEAGEDFTLIDVRNPDGMARGRASCRDETAGGVGDIGENHGAKSH